MITPNLPKPLPPKPLPYETGPKWIAVAGFLAVLLPAMAIGSYVIGQWVYRTLTE